MKRLQSLADNSIQENFQESVVPQKVHLLANVQRRNSVENRESCRVEPGNSSDFVTTLCEGLFDSRRNSRTELEQLVRGHPLFELFKPVDDYLDLWCCGRSGLCLVRIDNSDETFPVGHDVGISRKDACSAVQEAPWHRHRVAEGEIRACGYTDCSCEIRTGAIEKFFAIRRPKRLASIDHRIPSARGRKWLHPNLNSSHLVGLIREPPVVGRKRSSGNQSRWCLYKERRFLIFERIDPDR